MVELRSLSETLAQLLALLRGAAQGGLLRRDAAGRYMHCREVLLQDDLRPLLPGFLVQCGSIYKFAEFITLYHPNVASRLAFVDASFERCRQAGKWSATPAAGASAPALSGSSSADVFDRWESDL